jgi:hypothetical protein
MKIKHAHNPAGDGEYTMCGYAFDAATVDEEAGEIEFAGVGEAVSCQRCRRVVLEVRKIKLGRLPSNAKLT